MRAELDFLTVVSGLPRSGTSMAMRMLEAGGMSPVLDHRRAADEDNPLGYYEFEPVKALRDDTAWVGAARGRAVKIIYKLVYDLPADVPCRVLFMQRDLAEVLRSQEAMLARSGLGPGPVGRDALLELFQSEVIEFRHWARSQPHIDVLYLDYAEVVEQPDRAAGRMAAFLDAGLDPAAMARAVDPGLYRNRG